MENHDALMPDIMEDMDPGALSFIRNHVRSFPRWDLLRFLYHNQDTWDTAENLAQRVGRRIGRVETEVVQMAEEGLVCREGQGYSLTRDPEILALIEQVVSASQDRTFRMKLIYHILRAGGNE